MFDQEFLLKALIASPAILFALTVHEFFHAWTALKFGDTTARDMGRLTLNPLAHLDFLGTLMIFLSGFRFGWAKPVPINLYNLRNPRVADFWISAAGPLSNFALAFIFGAIFRFAGQIGVPEALYMFLYYSVSINVGLAVFNLLPLFPLDGSHILRNLLPESYGPTLDKIDTVAPYLLLALIMMGGVWLIIGPLFVFFFQLFAGISIT